MSQSDKEFQFSSKKLNLSTHHYSCLSTAITNALHPPKRNQSILQFASVELLRFPPNFIP